MKLKELKALKPGTEIYILFGCSPTDWSRTNQNIEKCIFEGFSKYTGSKFVSLQIHGRSGLWYPDRVFLTKEDAEIAKISFLLSGNY